MIAPSTRLFGLLMAGREEGHVPRIYNALFGYNGLDAAYLAFLVPEARLAFTLEGFKSTGQTEVVHVAPALQGAAGRWLGASGPVDTLTFQGGVRGTLAHPDASTWLTPEQVAARALKDATAWAGRPLETPPDWLKVVGEVGFRPCKLTHDVFGKDAP